MIIYCAANKPYFDLYFNLWAKQLEKYYPKYKKVIALYKCTSEDIQHANNKGVEVRDISNDPRMPKEPKLDHLYLLRWANLPYDLGENILETQINCLAVKGEQPIPKDNWGVEHARICRYKWKPQRGKILAGISAAVFTPKGAEKVVKQATEMLKDPPSGDHPMNMWQSKNLSNELVLGEQQYKHLNHPLEPYTYWITAGTSAHYTPEQKLEVLNHYVDADSKRK
jgi:hypothetical protein